MDLLYLFYGNVSLCIGRGGPGTGAGTGVEGRIETNAERFGRGSGVGRGGGGLKVCKYRHSGERWNCLAAARTGLKLPGYYIGESERSSLLAW
jgi:hypothetical protein